MSTEVYAPVAGTVVSLAQVPDEVFAAQLVGSGLAVEPADGAELTAVVAPITGQIVKLHPHAFVILGADGMGVLVHLGIDTVNLGGKGFTLHISEGAEVSVGDPVVSFSPTEIRSAGLSAIIPVVVMDSAPDSIEQNPDPRSVTTSDVLFDVS